MIRVLGDPLPGDGINTFYEEAGLNTYEGGYAAALRILKNSPRPDALFCISDIAALGALEAARHELKLQVPADLAVVGFDDISSASWPSYGLTTVRQPVQEMIAQSINLLLEQIEGKQVEPRTVRIPAELVVRTSAII